MVRVGEHNMFVDQGTHVDVAPEAIFFHPDRDRKYQPVPKTKSSMVVMWFEIE
jgi:hypothetical protein